MAMTLRTCHDARDTEKGLFTWTKLSGKKQKLVKSIKKTLQYPAIYGVKNIAEKIQSTMLRSLRDEAVIERVGVKECFISLK